jgi:Transglutaminase-like superfamily
MNLRLRYRLIVLNVLLAVIFKYATPAQWKIDVRQALFTDTTSSREAFCDAGAQISDFKWANDSISNLFLETYRNDSRFQLVFPKDTLTNVAYVKQLILKFSKNGGDGCGARSNDLAKNIIWISEGKGHGCCSDHSQVFIALCQLNGIKAREVHHKSHTFNEYFDTELEKWVWVDAQFALMAKDSTGNYLSFCELAAEIRFGSSLNWDFFGKVYHNLYQLSPNRHEYFQKSEFEKLVLTKGNNVFRMDYYNKRYHYVPTELRQFALLTVGIQPRYLQLVEEVGSVKKYATIRYAFWAAILLYITTNLFQWFRVNQKSN